MSAGQNERIKLAVRGLYDAQVLRIQLSHRISRLTRDEIMTDEEANEFFNLPFSLFEKAEREMEKLVWKQVKDLPIINEWLIRVKGVGPRLAGLLVANISPINRFANVAKLWAYAGLHTQPRCPKCDTLLEIPARQEGSENAIPVKSHCEKCEEDVAPHWKAAKRRKGEKSNWNQELKTTAWKLGQSFIKAGGPYRQLYDQYKTRIFERETKKGHIIYQQINGKWKPVNLDESAQNGDSKPPKNPEWTAGRINNMATRWVVKIFLAHLFTVWREMEGLPAPKPYQFEYLGHTHYYNPWDFVEEKKPSARRQTGTKAKKKVKATQE